MSCLGVGGAHLGGKDIDDKLAIRIIRTAIDHGITFLDNSWDYHKGSSERRMGKALKGGYRERAILMTKIDGRSAEAATKQLDESLKRLGVDCIDLVGQGPQGREAALYRLHRPQGSEHSSLHAAPGS